MSSPGSKAAAIRAVYAAVSAPAWAAPNLDALADVLRDLSWLAPGEVRVPVPSAAGLDERDRAALLGVLTRSVDETADSDRPVRLVPPD